MKFENIDLIDALHRIMDIHTQNYKEDFEMDSNLLRELAVSGSPADQNLLWMSRPNGTYLLREREVFIEGTSENRTWTYYHEQTSDPIFCDVLEHTGEAKASELSKKLADLPHDAQKRILQMVELMIQQEKENMN